jgi:hypothetical protein
MDLLNDMDIYLLCKLYFHFSHFYCHFVRFCLGMLHRLMVGYTNVACRACGYISAFWCRYGWMDGWMVS